MYPHLKYNPTNPAHPEPVGFCDRCNFFRYLKDLVFQMQWSGPAVTNTFLLVCPTCLDTLNEQGRTIVIGPDPIPLKDPRPGFWPSEEAVAGVPPIPPYVLDQDDT